MAGSKAFFNAEQAVADYLKPGTDEAQGCERFFDGDFLNVNAPEDKADLKGLVSGLKKIAAGIERDAHLQKRPGK